MSYEKKIEYQVLDNGEWKKARSLEHAIELQKQARIDLPGLMFQGDIYERTVTYSEWDLRS